MSIDFFILGNVDVMGGGAAGLALRSRALGQDVGAGGLAKVGLQTSGTAQIFFGGGVEPPIPSNGTAQLSVRASGEGYDRSFGAGAAGIAIRGKGLQAKPGQGGGGQKIGLYARGRSLQAAAAFAGLEERPAMISSFGGRWFLSPRSGMTFGGAETSLPTHVLHEAMAMDSTRRTSLMASCTVLDRMSLGDALAVVYMVLVEEGVQFGPTITADGLKLTRVVDRLLMLGAVDSFADAVNAVIGGVWFGALTEALRTETVVDGVLAAGVVSSLQRGAERLVDSLLADATAFVAGTGVALVSDQVAAASDGRTSADLVQLLRDGLGFVTRLALDTGEYVAWVMNTDNRAISRYTNFPFNSFAKIGGRYYGAAADGLHRLDGEDDDGVAVTARVRMGLSALGTRRLKRIPEAFVGYTASGSLLMHVITVNEESGQKEAAIYRILERPASSMRETRWKLGKGIKAVDFDFIIENADGADFDLSTIEFRPIYLDRRTRG